MRKLLALAFMLSGFLFITSCGEDDGDDDPIIIGEISIELEDAAEIENLGTYSTTVDISAEDGLASLTITKNGAAYADTTFTGEPTEATYDFSYTATAEDEDSNITFEFTVTDVDGDDDSEDLVLSVGEAPEQLPNEVLSGLITEDMTLTADRIYELAGRVIVTNDATLTIEPGTIIKGRLGEGANAAVLMIARDGMIDAEGTADAPIIFTTIQDNIALGETMGDNLTATDNQLWGGVVILGSAPISVEAGTTAQIEGVPAAESLGQYGGEDAADNSGVLKYVSIRHGGTTIDSSLGNDINGLTLGGVGSGTVISDVEVYANYDDGIEFFGGTVDVTNAVVYTVGDDALDIDQAYSGTVSNFIVFTSDAASSDEALEIDGPEGTAEGSFTLENGTIISVDGGGSGADFKSKAMGTVSNVSWSDFTNGATLKFRASYNDDCTAKTDAYTHLTGDELTFTTVEFGAVSVYTDSETCTVADDAQAAAAAAVTSETATGADLALFSWTLSSLLDLL